MLPSNQSNRIKLNRNAFRLQSGSVPKRRRAVGQPRNPLPGTDPALTDNGPQTSPPPNTREALRESPGDTAGNHSKGAPGPSRFDVINDTNDNDSVSEIPTQPRPISCRLRFALRFSDAKNATRKPRTEPGTVACYINGKVCVESSLRFGPAEPSGPVSTPDREQVISPPRHTRSSGVKPAPKTQLKPPWTRTSKAEAPNFNKKTNGKKCFGLVTRFGSGRHVKRSVKNSCCSLCGDVKYTAPAQKKQAGLHKPRLRFPGMPRGRKGAKVHRAAAQAKQKGTLIIWLKEYPRVNLCDVARVFDVTSRDFSCVLPVGMHQNWDQKRDRKIVPCLKKELRFLMHLYPNNDGKRIGSQISKVCAPTNRYPSLSSGERDSGTTEDQSILDIAVGHDDCPKTSDNPVSSILNHEKMRLTSIEKTPCLPTSCGNVLHPDKTDANKESSMASVCQEVPPLVQKSVPACNGFGSPQSYQCKPSVDHNDPMVGQSDALHSLLDENGMSEDSEGEVYSPHSFSCQRTQAYLTWPRFSCARTCRSWPFPRCGPPAEMKSAVRTGPRWITNSRTANSTEKTVSNMQPSLQPRMTHHCVTGKSVRYGPVWILGSSNEGLVGKKEERQTPITKLNQMETNPMEVQEASAEPTERQKETGKCAQSDHSMEDDCTFEKNVTDGPFKILGPSIKGLVDQKEQGQTPSSKFNKMETDPTEVQETSGDPMQGQKNNGKAAQSGHKMEGNGTIGRNIRDGLLRILGSGNKGHVDQKVQGQTSYTESNEMETDPTEVQDTSEEPTKHKKNNNKAAQPDHSMGDVGTIGKNVKDGLLWILGSRTEVFLSRNKRGQPPSTKLNKMETDPIEVQEASEEPAEHQKETNNSGDSELSYSAPTTSSGTEPVLPSSDKPLNLHAVETTEETESEENCSVEFQSPSDVGLKVLPLTKFLEGTEDVDGLATSQGLECIKDARLEQGTQQTSPSNLIILHPREDSSTSNSSSCSKMVYSTVEPQANSLVPIKEQDSIASVENVTELLCLKSTSSPVLSPSTSYSKQCKDETFSPSSSASSSSSGEDKSTNNLSPGECSEDSEVDAECSSLQDELCKSRRTNASTSPLCSPKSSMVAADDLDVLRAYEEDAIILDVIQDDPDLFGVVKTEGRLMQTHGSVASKEGNAVSLQPEKTTTFRNRSRIVWSEQESPRKLTAADCKMGNSVDFHTVDISEPSQGSVTQLGRSWLTLNPMLKSEQTFADCNNNLGEKYIDMTAGNMMMNSTRSSRLVIDASNSGTSAESFSVRSTAGTGSNASRYSPVQVNKQSSPVQYCYYYFSEHYACRSNMCQYLHSVKAEDEKFCMDTVLKFCRAGNPLILQRAVAVLVEYYKTNSPGASYNQSIVNSLLSCMLNLTLIRDVQSVINTLLTHKKTPPPDLMMALYERVRERRLLVTVPELILLTSKVVEAGCVFTVNQCEMMQSQFQMLQVPRQQMEIFQAVKCRALATNPQTTEVSVLAQAVVQVEMYKQQENWSELARVFCSVCNGHYSAGEVTRFCCCVTIALMTESKDKLTLPFELFAESVCQKEPPDGLVRSFLGRVGVSLMFKYYRILDWAKGMKVVLVMSRLHVEFSTLKGLFSSEEGMSRCKLITTATELFLNSGSIEGALNMLRADKWFVNSSTWPCEAGDVENRKRVLTLLAGKTSYRDTLEILSNLPGLSKPLDGVQVGEYGSVFNTHLRKCVMNQVLPVAADTLEFMLTQGITPDVSQLQNVIYKLGKQNNWNRARALFKRARSAGHYSEVGCATDSLALPCSLNEIEMTLAFEMFITGVGATFQNVNDSSQPLLITLKRTSGGETAMESRYLAAGCYMLSAAQIPNPKLSIRYMAVNQDQEQIFHLDRGSAAKWLSQNHTWAQEMWAS